MKPIKLIQGCTLVLFLSIFASQLLAQPFRGFGGRGGFGGQEKEFVEDFDADGDGILNQNERAAALNSMPAASQGRFRRGRGGNSIVPSAQGISLTQDDVSIYEQESLYDETILRTIFIEFESDNWEEELAIFNDSDVDVPAKVTVDNELYENVGVHFRGASSFMMVPNGSKRSLNLSFDFVDSDQLLLGFKTVNLLNAANDPTFLRAIYYSHVARNYIAAPKINFVRVVINNENWGVYLNAQQFNKDFIDDWFGSKDGARWKVPGSPFTRAGLEYMGDNIESYKSLFEIRSKDKGSSWEDLVELTKVLNETPPGNLIAELSPILDIDNALKFLALDVALVNTDGYWTRASDYSLYQDEEKQFHIIPHDMNETMMNEGGGFGRGARANTSLNPLAVMNDSTKPLHYRLLAVPELREKYLGYVKDIAENWLDWDSVAPVLEQYRALIREDVEVDTRKLYATERFDSEFDESNESLKEFFDERKEYLLNEL